MTVVLNSQTFDLEEGEIGSYVVPLWANPAHNVQLFIDILPPGSSRAFKVPLVYCTEVATGSDGGVSFVFERQSKVIVGTGVSFIPFRPTTSLVTYILYRRRNNEGGELGIRCRLINFSI